MLSTKTRPGKSYKSHHALVIVLSRCATSDSNMAAVWTQSFEMVGTRSLSCRATNTDALGIFFTYRLNRNWLPTCLPLGRRTLSVSDLCMSVQANNFYFVKLICNKIQTHKRFQKMLFSRTKHNMRILCVIPIVKLQNYDQTTIKRWKTMKMRWTAKPLICFCLVQCLKR